MFRNLPSYLALSGLLKNVNASSQGVAALCPGLNYCRAFSAAFLLAFTISGSAQIPKLNSISPEWVQRGTTADITINGENLSKISDFAFTGEDEHLEAVLAPLSQPAVRLEATSPNVFSGGPPSDNKLATAKLKISEETALGAREVRIITPQGISNPLTIRITDTPEIIEPGKNHSVAEAPTVTLPIGISGRIRETEQVDMFRFKAKKDDRLIFDVQASRIGSPLDSSLAILDSTGKELARNEDAFGMDSFISFTVPADGEYIVTIRDFEHRGGGNYTYHLSMGALPFLESIFPFGGQRGKTVELALTGINLEGAEKMNVSIDANAPGGPQVVRAVTAKGVSNPRQFDVSAFDDVTEKEPNNALTNATEFAVPGNVNGHLSKAGQTDFFKFKATKGQRLIFEIYASRFGSKLDPLITLLNGKGEVMQRNDDAMGADARIDQTFEEGEYFLTVRDLLDRGGDHFGYRISADPPPPADFSAKILADTVRLHRGGRTGVRVEVGRAGFGGAIEIVAEDLPEGVSASPLIIPADFPTGLLIFSASDTAKLGTEALQMSAVGVLGGKKVSRAVQAVSGAKPNVRDKRGRERKTVGKAVAAAYLTVLEAAPFTVDWVTLSSSVDQNETATVVAEIERRDGFTGDIALTVEGFAAGNEAIGRNFEVQPVTLKGKDTDAKFKMKAKLDSETGGRPIFVRADSTVDGMPVTQWSRPLPFRINEFPFVLSTSLPRIGVTVPKAGSTNSAAAEAEFMVRVQRRGLFTDDIQISLEGLPEGVTATSANLPRGKGEAEFKLTTTEQAKAGTNTLTVVGVANVNGREFRQRAPGMQFIVNAPEMNETAAVK